MILDWDSFFWNNSKENRSLIDKIRGEMNEGTN